MEKRTKIKSVCSVHGAVQAIHSFIFSCSECQNIVDGLPSDPSLKSSMSKLLERRSSELSFKMNKSETKEFSASDISKIIRKLKEDKQLKTKQKEEDHSKHVHDLISIIFQNSNDYSSVEYEQQSRNLMKSLLSDHPLKIDLPDLLSTSSELPNFSSSKSQINFELSNSSRKCIPPELKPVTLTKKKSNYTRKGFIALEEDISLQNEVSNFIPWFPQLRMTYPQLENINNNVRVLNMLKRKLADINYEKFNEISFPIDYSKCDLNGIMNPRYSYEVDTALDDPYDRHLAKLKEMRKKPLCIIVIGKPGLALYNLAAEIANTWDNILITPLTVMNTQSARVQDIHKRFSKQLSKGKRIEACDLFQIFYLIMDKLESEEVCLRGYTLAGIPFLRCDIPAEEQLSMVFGPYGVPSSWRPDVIVYAMCPSEDVIPVMETYVLEPEKDLIMNMKALERGEELVIGEEKSGQELDESSKAMFKQLQEQKGTSYLLELYNTKPYHIMEEVDVYIQVVLPALDVYIMEWDPQYMIQVDGRTPVLRMLEVVQSKLSLLGVSKTPSPYPLFVLKDNKIINDYKTMFSDYNLDVSAIESEINEIYSPKINSIANNAERESSKPNLSKASTISKEGFNQDISQERVLSSWRAPSPIESDTVIGGLSDSSAVKTTVKHSLEKIRTHSHYTLTTSFSKDELDGKEPTLFSKETIYKIIVDMSKGNLPFDSLNSLEDEDLLTCLKISKPLAENTRLTQSTLGTFCPVKLYEGYYIKGKAEWAVVYCGTIYLLSSEESQQKFLINPKQYLDPHPFSKTYTFVYGNPQKIVANEEYVEYLANELNVMVLDFQVLHEILLFHTIEPHLRKYVQKWKADKVAKLNEKKKRNLEKAKADYVKDVKDWQKSVIDLIGDYLETTEKLQQICDIVPQSLKSESEVDTNSKIIGKLPQLQKDFLIDSKNMSRTLRSGISTHDSNSMNLKQKAEHTLQQPHSYTNQTEVPQMVCSSVFTGDELKEFSVKNFSESEAASDENGLSECSFTSDTIEVHRAHGLIAIDPRIHVEDSLKIVDKSPHSINLPYDNRNNSKITRNISETSSSNKEIVTKEISVDHKKQSHIKKGRKHSNLATMKEGRRNSLDHHQNQEIIGVGSVEDDYEMDAENFCFNELQECTSVGLDAIKLERKPTAANLCREGLLKEVRLLDEEVNNQDGEGGISVQTEVGSIIILKPEKKCKGHSSKFITDSVGLDLSDSEKSEQAKGEKCDNRKKSDPNRERKFKHADHPNTATMSPSAIKLLEQAFNDQNNTLPLSFADTNLLPSCRITGIKFPPIPDDISEEEILISKTSLCSTEKEVKEISPNELLYFPYFQVHKTASKENYMQPKISVQDIEEGSSILLRSRQDMSLYRARRIISALGNKIFNTVSSCLEKEFLEHRTIGIQTMDTVLKEDIVQPVIRKSQLSTNKISKKTMESGIIRQDSPSPNYLFPPKFDYWKINPDAHLIQTNKRDPVSVIMLPRSPKPPGRRCLLHSSQQNLIKTMSIKDISKYEQLKVYSGTGIAEEKVENQWLQEFIDTTGRTQIASSFGQKYHQLPERSGGKPKRIAADKGSQCSKELLTSNPYVIKKSNEQQVDLLNEDLKKWAALLLSEAAEENRLKKVQNQLLQLMSKQPMKWNLRKIINYVERTEDASIQTETVGNHQDMEYDMEIDSETNTTRKYSEEEELLNILRSSVAMVFSSVTTSPDIEQKRLRSDTVHSRSNWAQRHASLLRLRFKMKGKIHTAEVDDSDNLHFINSPFCPKDYRKWQSGRFKKEVEKRKKFSLQKRTKTNFNNLCDAMLKQYIKMRILEPATNDSLYESQFMEEPYDLTQCEAAMIQKRKKIRAKLAGKDKDKISDDEILSVIKCNGNQKILNLIPNSEKLASMSNKEVLELLENIYFEVHPEVHKHMNQQCHQSDTKYLLDCNLHGEEKKPVKKIKKNYISLTELNAPETTPSKAAVPAAHKETSTVHVDVHQEEFIRDMYSESLEDVSDLLFRLHCEAVSPQQDKNKKPMELKTQIRLIPQCRPGAENKISSDFLLPPNFLMTPHELKNISKKFKKEWWRYLLSRIVKEWENNSKVKCFYSVRVFKSSSTISHGESEFGRKPRNEKSQRFSSIAASLIPQPGSISATDFISYEEPQYKIETLNRRETAKKLWRNAASLIPQPRSAAVSVCDTPLCVDDSVIPQTESTAVSASDASLIEPDAAVSDVVANVESELMAVNLIAPSLKNSRLSGQIWVKNSGSSISTLREMALSILDFILEAVGSKDFNMLTFEDRVSSWLEVSPQIAIKSSTEFLRHKMSELEKNKKCESDNMNKDVEKIKNIADMIKKSLTFDEEGLQKDTLCYSRGKHNWKEKIAFFNQNSALDRKPTKDAIFSYSAEETKRIKQIIDLIQESFGEDEESSAINSSSSSTEEIISINEHNTNMDKMVQCLTTLKIEDDEVYLKRLGGLGCAVKEKTSDVSCIKTFCTEDKDEYECKNRIKEVIRLADDLIFKCCLKQQHICVIEEKETLLDFKPKTYALTQDDLLSFSEDTSSTLDCHSTSSYQSSNNHSTGKVLLTTADIYNKVKKIIDDHEIQHEESMMFKTEYMKRNKYSHDSSSSSDETPLRKNAIYYSEEKSQEIRECFRKVYDSITLCNQKEQRKCLLVSNCGRLPQEVANLAVAILESLQHLKREIEQTDTLDLSIHEERFSNIEKHVDIILDISEECNKELPRRPEVFFTEKQARAILEHANAILEDLTFEVQEARDKRRSSFSKSNELSIKRHTMAIVENVSFESYEVSNSDQICFNDEQFQEIQEHLHIIFKSFDSKTSQETGSTGVNIEDQTEIIRKSLNHILYTLSSKREDIPYKVAVIYSQEEAQAIREQIYKVLQSLTKRKKRPRKYAVCYTDEEAQDIKNQVAGFLKSCEKKTPDHKPASMLGSEHFNKIMCLLKYNKHTYELDAIKQNITQFTEDISECSSIFRSEKNKDLVSRSESLTSSNQTEENEMISSSILNIKPDEFELFKDEVLEKLESGSVKLQSSEGAGSKDNNEKSSSKSLESGSARTNSKSQGAGSKENDEKPSSKSLESGSVRRQSKSQGAGSKENNEKSSSKSLESGSRKLSFKSLKSGSAKRNSTSLGAGSKEINEKLSSKSLEYGSGKHNSTNLGAGSNENNGKLSSKNLDEPSLIPLGFDTQCLSKQTRKKLESVLLTISSSSTFSGSSITLDKFCDFRKELEHLLSVIKQNSDSDSLVSSLQKHNSSNYSCTTETRKHKVVEKRSIEWQELHKLLKAVISIEERILKSIECPSITSFVFEKLKKYQGYAEKIDAYIKLVEDNREQILNKSLTINDDNTSVPSETANILDHYKALKRKFEIYGMLHFCYDNNRSFRRVLTNPDLLLEYLPLSLLMCMPSKNYDFYDENHPLIVEGATKKIFHFLKKLDASDWEISDMQLAKALAQVLKHFKNESNSFGWIVLNAPAQKSIWEYLESKNLTPNNVIYSQEVNCPSYLTTMICACEQYWWKVMGKQPDNAQNSFQEGSQRSTPSEMIKHDSVYSDEDRRKFTDLILAKVIKKMKTYSQDWLDMKKLIESDCKTKLSEIDVDIKQTKVFLKKLVGNITCLKHGTAHSYNFLDKVVYEPLNEQHPVVGKYAKGDVKAKKKNKTAGNIAMVDNIYGDTYPYCPVSLFKYGMFIEGNLEFRAVYKNQIYTFCSSEFKEDFLCNPESYMLKQPISLPPPRISVLGAIGCQGSRFAKQIATELGLLYLSFDQLFRTQVLGINTHPIGVLYESRCCETYPLLCDLVDTSALDKLKLETLRNYVNCSGEPNINSCFIFENLIKPFWNQSPYSVQGICYYRFPHKISDLQCLIEKNCLPDTIIYIQSPDNAVINMVGWVKKNWQLHRAVIKRSLYEQDVREIKVYMKYLKKLFKWNLQNLEKEQAKTGQEQKKQLFKDTSNIPPGISSLIRVFDLKLEQIRDPSLLCKALVDAKDQQSWYKFKPLTKVTDFTKPLEPLEDLQHVYTEETEEIKKMKILSEEKNILWLEQNVNDFKINNVVKNIQLLMCLRFAAVNRTQSVSSEKAQMLLDNGIFFLSHFGHQCPVQLSESDTPDKTFYSQHQTTYPVIYRSYIYFLSSKEAMEKFCKDPENYVKKSPYAPLEPVRCAIIGPPKSGKTELANRLAKEFGLQIIDIKSAVDYVLKELHYTKTARKIHEHLQKERLLTDDMAVLAIEAVIISPRCVTLGWVLDGFPHTKEQFEKLHEKGLIPMKVFSLETTLGKCLDNLTEEDLSIIWLDKDEMEALFKVWLESREPDFIDAIDNLWGNHCSISTTTRAYFSYQKIKEQLLQAVKDYHKYLSSLRKGEPTGLANVPVTPAELSDHLNSFFGMLCPGCLNYDDLRSFPSNLPFCFIRKQIIQFKHQFYWVCPKHFDTSLREPTLCFKEDSDKGGQICKRICLDVSLEQYGCALEYQGCCIVCYHKGMPLRVLNKGCKDYIVDYGHNFYSMCCDNCLQKFTARPKFFSKIVVEKWEFMPPQLSSGFNVEDLTISLNEKLYLERNVMPALQQALSSLVQDLLYIPGLSSQQAGCIVLGYNLKCSSINRSQKDVFRTSFHHLIEELNKLKILIETVKSMPNPYHPNTDLKIKKIVFETEEDKDKYLKGLLVLLNSKRNAFIALISQVLYFSKHLVIEEIGKGTHELATKWFILLNKIPNMFTDFLHTVDRVLNNFNTKDGSSITVEVRNEYFRSLFCTGLLSNINENSTVLVTDLTDFKKLLTFEEKEAILLKLNPFLDFIKDIKNHSESNFILTEFHNEMPCKIVEYLSDSKINAEMKEGKISPHNLNERVEYKILNTDYIKKHIDDLQFSRIKYQYDPYTQIHITEPCYPKRFGDYLELIAFPNKKTQPIEHTVYRSTDLVNVNVKEKVKVQVPFEKFRKIYDKYYKHFVKILIKYHVKNITQERVMTVLNLEQQYDIKDLDSKLKSIIADENKIHLLLHNQHKIKKPLKKEVIKRTEKVSKVKSVHSEKKPEYTPEASSFFKELVMNYNFDTVVKTIQNRFPKATRKQILSSITNVFPGYFLPPSKLSESVIVSESKVRSTDTVRGDLLSGASSELTQTYPWPGFNLSVTSDILRRLSIPKKRIRYSKQMERFGKI